MDGAALLLEAAVKGSLVLAVAFLAVIALRRGSAAARHWIWTLAAAAVLALPALAVLLPAWPLPILPESAPWSYTLGKVGPLDGLVPWPVFEERHPAGRAEPPWARAAALLWCAGALVAAARLGASLARARALVRRSAPLARGRVARAAEGVARELGLAGRVTFRWSHVGGTPMTLGIRRPIVLLPADAGTWSAERLRVVLLHELAHVQRRDCLAQLGADLACIAYWFHPLAWHLARRLRVERERASDDCVLRAGIRPSTYAAHLLALAWSGPAPAPAMAQRTSLEERLEAILDPRVRHHPSSRAASALAVLAVAFLVLPLAALDPGGAPSPAPELFTTHR
jgi:beta-lactamase regulating signal transducer with metallopeptidase domain